MHSGADCLALWCKATGEPRTGQLNQGRLKKAIFEYVILAGSTRSPYKISYAACVVWDKVMRREGAFSVYAMNMRIRYTTGKKAAYNV